MKLYKLLVLLILTAFAYSQHDEAIMWGKLGNTKIPWHTTFKNTDSLKFLNTTYVTEIDTSDTVYTEILYLIGDGIEGIATISFSIDSSDAACDSVTIEMRRNWGFDVHGSTLMWDASWINLAGSGNFLKSDTLYIWEVADSTWWKPCAGLQFRCYFTDENGQGSVQDTLNDPNLGPFIR